MAWSKHREPEAGQPVTLKHLAHHLGVHPTTVSMALRGQGRISEPTRQRVLALARDFQYTPNHVARSLRHRQTRMLGVVFPYTSMPYYATLLDALHVEADARGLHLEVHFHQWSQDQEQRAVRAVITHRVEGLILIAAHASSPQALEGFLAPRGDMAVVLIGSDIWAAVPSFVRAIVGTDHYAGARDLGTHLLQQGHRRIAALVVDPREHALGSKKVLGLQAALQDQPGAELILVPMPDDTVSATKATLRQRGQSAARKLDVCRRIAEQFLQVSPPPTAVVTSDEPMAQILLTALSARGLRVPQDISLACFDGTYLSELGTVPLTCVQQPFDALARRIMERVAQHPSESNPSTAAVDLLPPRLVHRSSVGPPSRA